MTLLLVSGLLVLAFGCGWAVRGMWGEHHQPDDWEQLLRAKQRAAPRPRR